MVDDQRSMVVILVFVAVFAIVSLNLDGITGMAVSAANNPVVIMSTELKIGDGTDSQGTGWVKPPTEVTFDVPLGVTYKKLIVESRGVAGGRDAQRYNTRIIVDKNAEAPGFRLTHRKMDSAPIRDEFTVNLRTGKHRIVFMSDNPGLGEGVHDFIVTKVLATK